MPLGLLPREMFLACPTGRSPRRRPRTHWCDYVTQLARGTPWDPPGRAGGSVRGKGSLGVPAQAAAPATQPRISGQKWMDGWKFKQKSLLQV